MDVATLVQQGWAAHPGDPAAVAARLEEGVGLVEDAEGATAFMHLVNHVVGDHLGRRADAARLCADALRRAGPEPGPAPHVHLAVARTLAGDDEGAEAALRALGDDAAQRLRVGLLVAQGHANAGAWGEADRIYREQLAAAAALPPGHAAERSLAVVSNNIATEIMNEGPRSDALDALLVEAAQTARTYWRRVGTWVHDERADYLLALVHNHLGRPAEALAFADRALETLVAADGEERVDEAFIHLARAAASRDLGAADDQAASLATAEALAADFEGDGLRAWFREELAKAR